ncbi:hypothetical protein GWK16_04695 [Roseomonas sp. JC162]|uniref:Uncharacterized protein n=1 Tax=Neoroseomonas marina TaxID=1232220 RepID=A0A848EB80_9PROT|nr:hypothetical protein [Neoroseomonas marina]NMJ40525.1 hypothetical protein [Neoroseomonas marina]
MRRPPSRTHLLIMVVAIGAALALVAVERVVGWPDWARADRASIAPMPR